MSVLAVVALLLPGFVVVEIAVARSARAPRSDLQLTLRALAYSLIVHLVFAWWTLQLVDKVDHASAWRSHVGAIVVYATVVLVVVPVAVGIVVNLALAHAERTDGPPPLWAAALGAGEARDAYDFAWQRLSANGGWVIIEMVGHTRAEPRLIGGRYGKRSAVGQTPSAHDIYLEQMCLVLERADGLREFVVATEPPRGIWISAAHISRLEILPAGPVE